MAKKREESTKESTASKSKAKSKARSGTPNRRASDQELQALKHEILGVSLLALALAALLALLSFEPLTASLEANAQTNLIGPVGAYLADTLFGILGVMAYLIPVALTFPGLCLLLAKPLQLRLSVGIGFPCFILFGSTLSHLYLAPRLINGYPAGGVIGGHTAEVIQAFLGFWGALIVVYLALILSFVWTTKLRLRDLVNDFVHPNALRIFESIAPKLTHFRDWVVRVTQSAWSSVRGKVINRFSRKGDTIATSIVEPEVVEKAFESDGNEQPVIRRPNVFEAVSDSQIVSEVETKTDEVLLHTTSRHEIVDASDSTGESETGTVLEMVVDDAKPIVNRRKSNSAPAEQIEIPLPEAESYAGYRMPPLHYLDYDDTNQVEADPEFLQDQAIRLVDALRTFKIEGRVTEIHPGPVVTMYEFEPAPGVRISKIAGLADDLAMALKAVKVRIVAPIPGKGVVGFEVPNAEREMVWIKEIIGSKAFNNKKLSLPMALGKDIHGEPMVTDLAKMPHLLVAGTTGSGKSVGVNGMITSLLYRMTPEEVRFVMVDPKMLELSIYEGIPHLLLPVVTDPKKAALALRWAVDEMERRYSLMKDAGVRDIRGFNRKQEKFGAEQEAARLRAQAEAIELAAESDADRVEHVPARAEDGQVVDEVPSKLPYIVVVIDEFADLMMVAGKEVEYCVARIAQKARAAGIHLILATQRPSTDVITGVIKANFPTRIAFQVSSAIDSRTILSTNGAENLLGKGDMLFMPPGTSKLTRIHGAFLSEEEIHEIVQFIGDQMEPNYLDESILEEPSDGDEEDGGSSDDDPMYEEAVRVVARDGRASTSHLQRRLSLGYNRAARIVDQMERDGLVGPSRGAKPRELNRQLLNEIVHRWDAA